MIVNISSYEKEQLKLHRSLVGVKGGGGQKQPSEQPSLQYLAVTLKSIFLGHILVESTTNSTNTLGKCTTNVINILSISFLKLWGMGRK